MNNKKFYRTKAIYSLEGEAPITVALLYLEKSTFESIKDILHADRLTSLSNKTLEGEIKRIVDIHAYFNIPITREEFLRRVRDNNRNIDHRYITKIYD